MISEYFTYHHNFDDIIKNDPVKQPGYDYWMLKHHPYENFCWNTDIFTDKEINQIIITGKRLAPKRAETQGKKEDCLEYRRSFVSWIRANSETEWIYRRITDLVNMNNEKYWNFDLEKIETLQFTHYLSSESGTYEPHVDPIMWNNTHNRKLSMSLQLSDPKEYDGGDLKLHISNNPITINKQKGLAVFFPSYTLHEVTPVTRGERYSLVAWIHGPNVR